MNHLKIAYIALGSNLGDRKKHLDQAVRMLQRISDLPVKSSPIYECPSQGVDGLPDFLNMVVEIQTAWTPYDILCYLKGAEIALGRQHRQRWHSREIDMDLIWFDSAVIRHRYFNIPHVELSNRRFVLQPLKDLNPELEIPIHEQSVSKLLEDLEQKDKGVSLTKYS